MNVYTQMQAVQKALSTAGIAKEDRNKDQNYYYRGIDAVQVALSPILAEHGLMIVPSVAHSEVTRVRTSTDKPCNHWMVKVSYTFIATNCPDGEARSMGCAFHGECYDMSDKGLGKAITSAFKTMLFEVFCIPVQGQDDADAEHIEESTFISPEEVKRLTDMCKETKTKPAKFLEWLGVDTFDVLPSVDFGKALNALEQKAALNKKKALEKSGGANPGDTNDDSKSQGE